MRLFKIGMQCLLTLAITMVMHHQVRAQSDQSFDAELDSELDRLYQGQSTTSGISGSNTVVAPPSQARGNQQQQPVYIINQATPTSTSSAQVQTASNQQAIQKQPVTYVQDTPLVESRAEEMRRQRQQAEIGTESKIVEKLEQSRIDDEKRRADALFGNSFQQMKPQPPPPEPVYAQPVAPVIIQKVEPRQTVQEEVDAAIRASGKVEPMQDRASYFGGLIGFSSYPNSERIVGNYSLGFSFGSIYDDNVAVEGSFLMSNYTFTLPYYSYGPPSDPDVDVDQYGFGVGVKYLFLDSFFRPYVGGIMQYSYREYERNYYNPNLNGVASSHAIDFGPSIGGELAFASGFSLGLEYRYLFNLYSRLGKDSFYEYGGFDKIEKYSHDMFSLSGRFQF